MSRTSRRRIERTARAVPPAESPGVARGALVLWSGLALLTIARALLAGAPGMWLWGLNVQRFLDPLLAWVPWTLGLLALLPPVARRLLPPLARAGDALARGSMVWTLALVALVGLLVWGSPDNARFVGDFLLRQGTVEEAAKPAIIYPQALPLDVLLHYTIPTALQNAHVLSANGTGRALGVVNAMLLAWFAARLVIALGLDGAAAAAAWAVAVFGASLGMFTGYSKSVAEEVCLCVAIAAFGVRFAREGRGAPGLGAALAVGLALHRSALVFLLPAGAAFVLGARRADDQGAPALRRKETWAALALPLVTLALVLPRNVSTLLHVDIGVHLAPAETRHAGILAAAFGGLRLLDVANLVLLLAPLAPLAASAASAARTPRAEPAARGSGAGAAAAVLLALALPLLAIAPFLHPAQGMFRDWDDFAEMGTALSLVAAWLAGALLARARALRWIAVPIAAAAVLPAMQWLALNANVNQGLARARAYVTEPPTRPAPERVAVWDYVGVRNFRLGRWGAASEAFSHAVADAPSPRMLEEWAVAATQAGELRNAQAIYHQWVAKDSTNATAWLGLGAVASRIPDVDDSFRAIRKVLELDPRNSGGRQIMEYLKQKYPDHP